MKQRHLLTIFLLLSVVVFVALRTAVSAGYTLRTGQSFLDQVKSGAGVTETDITTVAGKSIKGAIQLVGLFFFVLMVYGGLVWMTARGNEDRVTKARNTVFAAIIGIIIVVMAYAITVLVGRIT